VNAPAARAVLTLCVALAAAPACAYFNGMFNAKRAARDAEALERQGRTAEARDRWQRAVVHAESLSTRHPRSRWADDALLLRGRALVRLQFNSEAAVVLEQAVRRAGTPAQRAAALTLLGQANVALGRFAAALAQLDSALAVPDAGVAAEALLFRGRALLALGDLDGALADFAASRDARAPLERARALLAGNDTAGAAAQLELLVGARRFEELRWRGPLDTLALLGAARRASLLTERLASRADVTPGERARLFLDDGDRRLAARDREGAGSSYRRAAEAAPDSVEARVAGVRLARIAVTAAADSSGLAEAKLRLEALAAEGGAAAREAQPLLRALERAGLLEADTVAPDASWYLRAELLRDSLGARGLAASAFAGMAARFPRSPWAPKGLLAAIAAGHPGADSLRALLDGEYRDSPYRSVALGWAAEGPEAEAYRALEDSLGRALAAAGRERLVPERAPRQEARPRQGQERPGGAQTPRPTPSRPSPRVPPEESLR